MSAPHVPGLVSIGMPVFNEARHVDAALASLRAQDYRELEIIICDNASTDETLDICRAHAAADPRLRIETVAAPISVTDNFNRPLGLARGEFFMWASGHDLWAPDLLRRCVELLAPRADACLAYGSAQWIAAGGETIDRESGWTDTRGMDPVARFFTVLWGNVHPVLGVMRTDALLRAGPLEKMVGADLVLLSSLSLRGHFLHADGAAWWRRQQRVEVGYAAKMKRYTDTFSLASTPLGRVFPLLRLPLELARVIVAAPLGWLDRAGMLAVLLPSLLLRLRVGKRAHGR